MLVPDKYTNPKYTVLYIAGIMQREIQNSGIIHYDELKGRVALLVDENALELFPLANSFLFLLDKIEYIAELDSIKAIG